MILLNRKAGLSLSTIFCPSLIATLGVIVTQSVKSAIMTFPVPSGTVEDIGHQNLTETSVIFTWKELSCSRRGGSNIRFRADVWKLSRQSQETIFTIDTSDLFLPMYDLEPLHLYGIRVCAVNAMGSGPYSDDYTVVTGGQSE